MATLTIDHPITDYATWRIAFDSFAVARERAGVTAQRIRQPDDDPAVISVELDFADPAAAHGFEEFLRRVVWANPASSPALAGEPVTRVLVEHA